MTIPDFFNDPDSESPDFLSDLDKVYPIQSALPDFFSDSELATPASPQNIPSFHGPAQASTTPYDVPDLSPEQLKKLPISQRLQYAKDLATEREFRQSRGMVRGTLSGASLGLSESIPGLKPEEGDFLTGFGEFIGSALPISKLYNVLGKPLVKLAAKSPIARSGIQALARMTGMGLSGAAYEGAKETIKEGEVPTPKELLKFGAQWAAFDGALQALGKTASFLSKLNNASKVNNVSQKEALNNVVSKLEKEKISPLDNPEEAVVRAEEILDVQPEVGPIASSTEPTTASKQTEQIIETTGQGAGQRIEYAKTGIDKSIAKANEYIQAAKTPTESFKRLGQAANESIFNALAPLERLETEIPVPERASTRIRLAQSAASEINSVLENGIFSNITGRFEHEGLKGAYGDLTWKKLTKNLKETEYSLEELDTFRVSKAAVKRQAEGKKTGVDTKKAQEDIKRLAKKYQPIDTRVREFQKATLNQFGTDLLGKDLIEKWNQEYYAPLFRVMEEGKDSILKAGSLKPKQPFKKMEGSKRKIIPPSESDPYNTAMLVRNARKNDAILQYRTLVEQGKLPGKIKQSKNAAIPDTVLKELDLDPEMNKVAETLYNQTRQHAFTPEKNILRGWKEGKPFEIEVPESVYNVYASTVPEQRSGLARAMSAINRLFSKGITLEPRKFGSIMARDALSSLVYSRTGSNPVSIFEALGDIFKGKPVYKEFLSMGGDVYAGKLAERIDRAKRIEDLITPKKEGILVPFEKMGDYFRKYTDTLGDISLAVPLAEYKRALAKFGNTPEGRILAALEARRVTYDPTRKGNSKIVRELGNYIPFWNVSLQDLAMVGKNLKSPETWVKGFTAITLPTLLLKMTNEGNPEYQDLTPVDKAAFWHLYFGDKHVRIPIPWLLGTAFKVGAEAFYDTVQDMIAKGDPKAKEAWEGLYENFAENLSGSVPPALQIYVEMSTGKSLSSPLGTLLGTETRAPEVVPKRLQHLPPQLQYTSKTSQLARKFANLWGISPVKLERALKGLGGGLVSDALALTDEIAYFTGMAEDKRPEQRESNYLLLGNFVSNNAPNRTKYMNEFYEYLNEATQLKNAGKVIREKGITDVSLNDIEYKDVTLFKYQRTINSMFKEMRDIENSSQISPKEKKAKLNSLQREINNIYKHAVEQVREAKQTTPKDNPDFLDMIEE